MFVYPHPVERRDGPVEQSLSEEHEVSLQELRLEAVAGDDGGLHHVVDERA